MGGDPPQRLDRIETRPRSQIICFQGAFSEVGVFWVDTFLLGSFKWEKFPHFPVCLKWTRSWVWLCFTLSQKPECHQSYSWLANCFKVLKAIQTAQATLKQITQFKAIQVTDWDIIFVFFAFLSLRIDQLSTQYINCQFTYELPNMSKDYKRLLESGGAVKLIKMVIKGRQLADIDGVG